MNESQEAGLGISKTSPLEDLLDSGKTIPFVPNS